MKRLVGIVSTLCFLALGLIGFAILMTIGMSKSGPSLGEAIAEFWPVGAAFALTLIAIVLNRTRPGLAAVPAAGAAGLLLWLFKVMSGS
ncbi:MAG TPA: hypothetical protein VJ775_06305 [Sphingomicrobium sp.]|nr:hypothetical protein [Sphingomicrobium sp.]